MLSSIRGTVGRQISAIGQQLWMQGFYWLQAFRREASSNAFLTPETTLDQDFEFDSPDTRLLSVRK